MEIYDEPMDAGEVRYQIVQDTHTGVVEVTIRVGEFDAKEALEHARRSLTDDTIRDLADGWHEHKHAARHAR